MTKIVDCLLFDWWKPANPPIGYSLELNDNSVQFRTERDHQVWLELEDGCIRVHCYRPGHDDPLNIEIYDDRIEVFDESIEASHIFLEDE